MKVVSGDGQDVTYELSEDTVIGRDPSCGIVLSYPAVSRNHAKIVLTNNHCRVVDLESKAGTFLNGKRVTSPVELLDGDVVRVGPVALNVLYLISSKPERTQKFGMGSKSLRFDDLGSGKLTRRIAIDTDHFSQTRRYFKESKALGASPEEISEQLESLLQLTTSILALKKRRALFPEIAQQLLDFFKEADRVLVLEADKDGVQQVQEVKHGPHSRKKNDDSFDRTILSHAVDERQAVLHGTRDDQAIHLGGPTSVICAPLWHGEKILGALYLDGRTAKFSESHLRFLTAMANIVASALQNVRLFEAVSSEAAQRAHLARYFSKDLVERILADKIKPARKGDIHDATILMVDLCGFSRLTNQVTPAVLITSLNQYFGAMQRIIFKNRGTVERFGGDSILAYWGVIEQDK
ncbi:MAG: FHA domain-containing protein, partial [Planctomycetota bacterium]|nr:FHA domain-containing protein [Planctomycetota bacterium]